MIKIVIYNFKGGVGKTLTTATLGHLFATCRTKHVPGAPKKKPPRVLMIDFDPQGNLSQFYHRFTAEGPCGLRTKEIVGTDWPYLDIMPGNKDLNKLEREMYQENDTKPYQIIKDYDIVLMDCPPAFNMLTDKALSMADYIIVPVKLDAFSSQGLVELDADIEDIWGVNPTLRLLGVLITDYEEYDYSAAAESILRERFNVFKTRIDHSRKAKESMLVCRPIGEMGMNLKPAWQYRKVANEAIKRIKEMRKVKK